MANIEILIKSSSNESTLKNEIVKLEDIYQVSFLPQTVERYNADIIFDGILINNGNAFLPIKLFYIQLKLINK